MNITMEAVQRGYDAWAAKPHNTKWVRKIDGTPIANDIVATIFNSLREDEEDRREQTLATVAAPDNGAPLEVLAAVHACAKAWVPEARIIGNVRAGDIARAIEAISSAPAPQSHVEGFTLVPTRMTASMINAWSGGPTVSTDEVAYHTTFQDAWKRVLEAAPAPVSNAEGEP